MRFPAHLLTPLGISIHCVMSALAALAIVIASVALPIPVRGGFALRAGAIIFCSPLCALHSVAISPAGAAAMCYLSRRWWAPLSFAAFAFPSSALCRRLRVWRPRIGLHTSFSGFGISPKPNVGQLPAVPDLLPDAKHPISSQCMALWRAMFRVDERSPVRPLACNRWRHRRWYYTWLLLIVFSPRPLLWDAFCHTRLPGELKSARRPAVWAAYTDVGAASLPYLGLDSGWPGRSCCGQAGPTQQTTLLKLSTRHYCTLWSVDWIVFCPVSVFGSASGAIELDGA